MTWTKLLFIGFINLDCIIYPLLALIDSLFESVPSFLSTFLWTAVRVVLVIPLKSLQLNWIVGEDNGSTSGGRPTQV